MSLKICMLASGSKGNCTYISDGVTDILMDIGLCYRDLSGRAQTAGIDLSKVSAVINSHCHSDHCKGMRTFINRNKVPVYSHIIGSGALKNCAHLEINEITEFDKSFNIGGILVTPFCLSHDAPYCCGFSFVSGDSKISIATDLGKTDEKVLANMYESNLVVIESNHDTDMLKFGRYPENLKRRILSDKGHLSNSQCSAAVKKLFDKGTKNFILAHLSEENNLPELAFSSLTEYLKCQNITEGRDYNLSVAGQHKISKIYNV